MVVNIRGTHGSGKSTLIFSLLSLMQVKEPLYRVGRRRPFGYNCSYQGTAIWVPGSYETPTGGCDTISRVEDMFSSIRAALANGERVLFEGILAQHSTGRLLELKQHTNQLIVIVLATPLEQCIASVRERRAERGDDRPFDPKNVEKEYRSVISSTKRLRAEGVQVETLDRDAALARALELLAS